MTNNNIEVIHDLPRLLKVSEAAELLNIGISTVYHLVKKKQLSCVRIGRTIRIRPTDLNAFIENGIDQTHENSYANQPFSTREYKHTN